MIAVKVQGFDELIRCADLVRCQLIPSNLVLVGCMQPIDVDPHPRMRGDWSIPANLVVHFVRGEEVEEHERPGYVPRGPTKLPESARNHPRNRARAQADADGGAPGLVEVPPPADPPAEQAVPNGAGHADEDGKVVRMRRRGRSVQAPPDAES